MIKKRLQRIVVIDDDPDYLTFITTLLARESYSYVGFTRTRDALNYLRYNQAALIITDLFMPDTDGFEVLQIIAREFPWIRVIAMSGAHPLAKDFYLDCAEHLGAIGTLRKPFTPDDLRHLIAETLSQPDE